MIEKLLQNRLAQNLLFWLCYAVVPFLINLGRFGSLGDMYTDIQSYVEYAVLGYLNSLVLMPLLFDRKRYMYYGFALLSMIAVSTQLNVFITAYLSPNYESSLLGEIYNGLDTLMFVLAFGSGQLIRKYVAQTQRMRQLEDERLKAELSFLKAQINPHLLFNTLNTLYSHSLEQAPQTPQMILKLSELMRYMLYETNESKVELRKEIDYLSNYIALQQLRIQDRGEVVFEVKAPVDTLKIAPMLLISFVENAFKYSMDSLTENIFIIIELVVVDTTLHFKVHNNYEQLEVLPMKTHGGLGLQNTKKRLDLAYPDRHQLEIHEHAPDFIVQLSLQLDD